MPKNMTEAKLLELKQQVEEVKQTSSELKGHLSALMTQLKNEWDCNSIEEAEKKLLKMESDIDTISETIEKKTEELEEKYNV